MTTTTIYQFNKQDLKEAMSETITGEVEEKVFNRFSNRLVGSNTVCEILGICRTTLTHYINEGRVTPLDPRAKYFKFELSEILRLDTRKFSRTSNLNFKKI